MTVRVRLLGAPAIEVDDGQAHPQPRGRKSWALLARIAMADRPLMRRELAAELFDAADDPLAALRWSLADLRRSLGASGLLRGDPLCLTRDDVWLDVWALDDGSLPSPELGGVLLDGVDLRDAPGFGTWLLMTRSRYGMRAFEELREQALRLLATGRSADAAATSGTAARLDPLDEQAQELFLRCLVADGQSGLAQAHLAACEGTFAREGMVVPAALREAARDRRVTQPVGVRARALASSLLRAGTAALDAGAADGAVDTLRRAVETSSRADDPALRAEAMRALGSALVHAVRGSDGEGAVVLHQALLVARAAERPDVAADVLTELGFIDIQAGRHTSAARALDEAAQEAAGLDDAGVDSGILGLQGMNAADRGQHVAATALLGRSIEVAELGDRQRQKVWSLGVLARSLLLIGETEQARLAAEASIDGVQRLRWNAFLPWPQAIHAECLAQAGRWDEARAEAELAFALGCELGDPCWEGMAARTLSRLAQHSGDHDGAWAWIVDARRRADRVPDRYVWVSAYVGLAQLELAPLVDRAQVVPLAHRLYEDAVHADLPEFVAWALVHQAEAGDKDKLALARVVAQDVDSPSLHRRIGALG